MDKKSTENFRDIQELPVSLTSKKGLQSFKKIFDKIFYFIFNSQMISKKLII